MATLTYDSTPADQPEFNEAEQEALKIGEQAAVEQADMLAGKFKDAEALEQAYIELQKKLGEPKDEVQTPSSEGQEEPPAEEEVTESFTLLNDATVEYNEKGELSPETVAKLSEMSSAELISAYMEAQQQTKEAPVQDLNQSQVDSIYKQAGGQEQYTNIMNWAADALPEPTVEAYNQIVNSGDPTTIGLVLEGIKAAYINANGYEGETITGKPPSNVRDVFRSQAEVVQAMSDPRYDRDPAYRSDVFQKLERSNIDY